MAAQLVSRFQADGHICLPLGEITAGTLVGAGISARCRREHLDRKTARIRCVGQTGRVQTVDFDEAAALPTAILGI